MSPNDRERLIERYLSGKMSPAEETQLHRAAASDPELRQALRVEQSIRRAFAADRAAIPAEDPQARAQLVAALGNLAPGGLTTGGAAAGPATGGFLAGGLAKILAVGVVALGLGSGIYFLPAVIEGEAASHETGRSAPSMIATPPNPLPAPDTLVAAKPQPAATTEISPAPEPEAAPVVTEKVPHIVEEPPAPSTPVATPAPQARDTAHAAKPVVVTSDSVRVKVNLNLEGLK